MSRMCQIKASAGSGKTYTLTSRYLKLISEYSGAARRKDRHAACYSRPDSVAGRLGDILAITFTNAAVTEIRERVITNLKKGALNRLSLEEIDSESARKSLDALLENMDEMNVRTIDSLLHQIVRAAALSLRINPDFEPTFNVAEALRPYLDRYMEEAFLGDEDKLAAIREAVEKYLEYDSTGPDKAEPLITHEPLADELEKLLEDTIRKLDNFTYPDIQTLEEAREKYKTQSVNSALEIKKELERLNKASVKGTVQFLKPFNTFLESVADGDLNVKDFNFLREDLQNQLFKSCWGKFDIVRLEESYDKLVRSFTAFKAYNEHLKYSRLLELADSLVNNFLKDLPRARALPSILIPVLARRALSTHDGVCDSLCRLGSRLSHFMIDEFQDTSMEQWEGIHPLLEESLSRDGSLTWVGDIKQSIYMWRGARPELFDGILMDKSLTCMVEKVKQDNLPYNWRSAKKIVDFNNTLFKGLENPDYVGKILSYILSSLGGDEQIKSSIANSFSDSEQKFPKGIDEGGLISINCIEYDKSEKTEFWNHFRDELKQFLNERLNEKSDVRPSDILILVRKNDEATLLATELAAQGISVITENSLLLSGENLIEETIALLDFMANPYNDKALQTVLCGECVLGHEAASGLNEDDMHRLAFEKGDKHLVDHLRATYPALWEKCLKPFYEKSTLMAPYDIIKEWFRTMDLVRRYPERQLFLSSFLEYAHNAELKEYNSIPSFLEKWGDKRSESKAAMPDGVDAIKIMTVHKAKGLQAPIVIMPIPDTDLKVNTNQHLKRSNLEIDGLMLNVRRLKIFGEIYDRQLLREAQEILNLLYVAFTRAEKELHIYTSFKKQKEKVINNPKKAAAKKEEEPKKPFLQHMLEEAGLKFPYFTGKPWPGIKRNEELAESQEQPSVETGDLGFPWISKLRIARNTLFSAGDKAKRRGTFIHFCLENLRLTGQPEDDARRALNFAKTHSGINLSEDDMEEIYENILWFSKIPEASAWIRDGWHEQSMLDAKGNELRVDVLVPKEWGALIIDYKSGHASDGHVEQMRNYMECLVQSGEFGDKICALLVYLDQRKFLPLSLERTGELRNSCPNLPFDLDKAVTA